MISLGSIEEPATAKVSTLNLISERYCCIDWFLMEYDAAHFLTGFHKSDLSPAISCV